VTTLLYLMNPEMGGRQKAREFQVITSGRPANLVIPKRNVFSGRAKDLAWTL